MTDSLYLLLIDTARVLEERLDVALKGVDLSRAKMDALDQLARAGEPLSLQAMAEEKGCVPSNMTTLVKRLESDGLVRRVIDPHDRRSVRAELTPLGADRAAAGAREVARVTEEIIASLRLGERAALSHILARLSRAALATGPIPSRVNETEVVIATPAP